MYDNLITLIAESKSNVNEYGDIVPTCEERTIFCDVRSIGQKEFYQAQALGFAPEIKFVIADYLDYKNEKKLKYRAFNETTDTVYDVIRTYRNNNELEIVCKRGIE